MGTMSIQQNLRSAVEENRANGARVKRQTYIINRKNFEQDFIDHLKDTKGSSYKNLNGKHVKFAYLTDSDASSLNGKYVNKNLSKENNDFTNPNADYVAIKGVRVLIDGNGNGSYTDKQDLTATLAVSTVYNKGEK